nr:hypothetical protein [Komagataeibacter diospyri]
MLSDVRILGSNRRAQAALHAHVDPLTRQRLAETQDPARWREVLSTARFTPPLPLLLAGIERSDGTYSPDTPLAQGVPYAAAAQQMAQDHVGDAPSGFELAVGLEIDDGTPRFLAWFRPLLSVGSCPETSGAAPPAPVGQPAATVAQWFSVVSAQPVPEHDARLATARQAADAYMHRSKAGNTLRTYRAAIRSWCQWAAGHALPALACPRQRCRRLSGRHGAAGAQDQHHRPAPCRPALPAPPGPDRRADFPSDGDRNPRWHPSGGKGGPAPPENRAHLGQAGPGRRGYQSA